MNRETRTVLTVTALFAAALTFLFVFVLFIAVRSGQVYAAAHAHSNTLYLSPEYRPSVRQVNALVGMSRTQVETAFGSPDRTYWTYGRPNDGIYWVYKLRDGQVTFLMHNGSVEAVSTAP